MDFECVEDTENIESPEFSGDSEDSGLSMSDDFTVS